MLFVGDSMYLALHKALFPFIDLSDMACYVSIEAMAELSPSWIFNDRVRPVRDSRADQVVWRCVPYG